MILMADRGPVLAALAISAATGAAWASIALTATIGVGMGNALTAVPALLAIAFTYSLVFCLTFAATLGLLWHALCQKVKWTNWFAYTIAGGLSGAVIGHSYSAFLAPNTDVIAAMAFVGSVGLVMSFTAWLIRRPDRDAAP